MLKNRNTIIAILVSVSTLALAGFQHRNAVTDLSKHAQQTPPLILWSWQHNDDLSYIDPKTTAVAFYAGTIVLGFENATLEPRYNSLKLPKDILCFPVFRIESAHSAEDASVESLDKARKIIHDYLLKHPAKIVQIDYDAAANDRKTYLQFLKNLRREIPPDTFLSITSLASWSLQDKWLQSAAIDESVAMMFSMGKGRAEALSQLSKTKLDTGGAYQQSLGISVSEEQTNKQLKSSGSIKSATHIYAFSSLGWTKSRYDRLREEVAKQL